MRNLLWVLTGNTLAKFCLDMITLTISKKQNIFICVKKGRNYFEPLKDGAYYCYCTYVLRNSEILGFPIADAY